MKRFLRIAAFEFLSKGLTWLRVLFAAFLMSDERYGMLILFISAEALLGGFASFPQIRSVLLVQKNYSSELKHTVQLWAIASLIALPLLYVFFRDPLDIIFIIAAGGFFAAHQTILYILRVVDIAAYNSAKLWSAALGTIVFLWLTPVNPRYFILVSAIAFLVVVVFWLRQPRQTLPTPQFLPTRKALNFWGIFGVQSLLVNLAQYGSRFVVSALFGLAEVAMFTKAYMIASGVSFAFSGLNVYGEKRLSQPAGVSEVMRSKVKFAGTMLGFFILSWIVYVVATSVMFKFGASWFPSKIGTIDMSLLLVFHVMFFVQIFYLVLNPMVISDVAPAKSLKATVISLIFQIGALLLMWNSLTLVHLGLILALGQIVRAIVLFAYLILRMRGDVKSSRTGPS